MARVTAVKKKKKGATATAKKVATATAKKVATATAKRRAGKKPPRLSSLVVDTAMLAGYFGTAQRTVRHWAKVEGMPKLAQNTYDLVAVRRWEVDRLRSEIAAQQVDDRRLKKYSADEREHRAKLLEMRKLKMAGLLVDRKEVERNNIAKIGAVKSGMEMLGRRIAGRIEGEGVEKIVDEEVELCCRRFGGRKESSQSGKK